MKSIWKRLKIVREISSAEPPAAILENPEILAGTCVGVNETGGDLDLDLATLTWN